MVNKNKSNVIAVITIAMVMGLFPGGVSAASTSNFQQTINPGTLTVDIVDAGYASVASPAVVFPATPFNFACQTNTGTLGTASEKIYVKNPDAADNGWTVSIAGSALSAVWDGAATDYDFNDPTTSGCTDGADADSVGGQMSIDPSAGTLAVGTCASCVVTNISKGTVASFSQTVTDSITLLSAAAGSSDIGDWTLTGVTVNQKIPAEQPAASDYDINMTLSIVSI